MDAQQFLAEFGHIANAPNGIVRLRELILCLATQGKLVPQHPDEPSAATLLENIELDKKRLIKVGTIKSPKPLPEIGPSDISYALPASWAWVRFGDIAMHNSGKTLDSMRNSGQPRDYITTSNLYWGRFELGNVKKMLIREEELEKCTARNNDLLICEGGEAGRAAVWTLDYEVCFQNHVHRARFYGGVNPFFAYRFFEKINSTEEIVAHRKGIGISNMSSKALAMIPFPLPPKEEQSRIVAKVDELMALCDKLETQQQDRRKLQNNLRLSTLQAVASATSPHELQTTWTRLADNFRRLFYRPEDVNELRTVILELAVRGFLSEQLQSDGDATELIQSLPGSDNANVRSSRTKRLSQQREIAEVEHPFALPFNWTWVRLSEIGYFLGGGTPSKTNPDYWRGDVPWVSPKDMKVAYINSSQDTISRKAVEETAVKLIPPGALLVVVRGMILAHSFPVGMACQELTINQDMKALCPYLSEMSKFLLLLLSASKRRFLGMVERSTHGTCRLETDRFVSCVVGLPPLAEQQRIVERVTQLMRFCDALESDLRHANELSGRLATASVSSFTGITTEQKKEPMKVPQTELIAPLRLGQTPDIKAQSPLATILVRHNGEMPAKDLWQRFGGEIDAFYAQLKIEVAHGWIDDPTYDLEDKNSKNPKSYPDGKYVAKMILKEHA